MQRHDETHDATAGAEFERFVERHGAELSRLAFLLTGDPDEADDLAADVLLAAWRQWDRVSTAERPLAYLRRTTANMAASSIRRKQRWRARLPLLGADLAAADRPPDGSGVDVRRALARLPARRRACVVLRLAFDLSEREVADTLQIGVGTVKSQTAKAVRTLRELLDVEDADATRGERGHGPTGEIDSSLFARPANEHHRQGR